MDVFLFAQFPDGTQKQYKITKDSLSLGRSPDNDVPLPNPRISREHAIIFRNNADNYKIKDLGSTNGTFVNGIQVQETALELGNEIMIGDVSLIFSHFEQQQRKEKEIRIQQDASPNQTIFSSDKKAFLQEPHEETSTDLRRINRDLTTLFNFSTSITSIFDTQELLNTILSFLCETFLADRAIVARLDEEHENQKLKVIASKITEGIPWGQPISRAILAQIIERKKAILSINAMDDERFDGSKSILKHGMHSIMCAPLKNKDKVIGIIQVDNMNPTKHFTRQDLDLFDALSNQASNAYENVSLRQQISQENKVLRQVEKKEPIIVYKNSSMDNILNIVQKVAPTEATVLVRGENGTGKELIAQTIHYNSPRKNGPFIAVNCVALAETLLESELFGHEAGAFTGAKETKLGRFELANGGTIFLDEIGETKLSTQLKLLRVLQEMQFERVGGMKTIQTDVRVLAATNRNLEDAIRKGEFREDLYYRLQVVQIFVPPLRHRKEDIEALINYYIEFFGRQMGISAPVVHKKTLEILCNYQWPGNVRELKNVIERAIILGNKKQILPGDIFLGDNINTTQSAQKEKPEVFKTLDDAEKEYIFKVLQHTGWNKRKTAQILNIARTTLDRKIASLNLNIPNN